MIEYLTGVQTVLLIVLIIWVKHISRVGNKRNKAILELDEKINYTQSTEKSNHEFLKREILKMKEEKK